MQATPQAEAPAPQFFDPWEPPPTFAAPPADANLAQRIVKLAEFAIRNGPQFIELMKTKQRDNPEYAFLFGNEGYQFYRWVLYCSLYNHPYEQPLPGTESQYAYTEPAATEAQPDAEQHGDGASLATQGLAATLPPEVANGFAQVLEALTGSKESIKSSQNWFMHCAAYADGMAYMMASRVVQLEEHEKQLHVIYLANDILFKSLASRPPVAPGDTSTATDPVSRAFEPVLGAMLAAIHKRGGENSDVTGRLEKILAFWGERHVYSADTIAALRSAMLEGDPEAILQAAAQREQEPAPVPSTSAPATNGDATSAPISPLGISVAMPHPPGSTPLMSPNSGLHAPVPGPLGTPAPPNPWQQAAHMPHHPFHPPISGILSMPSQPAQPPPGIPPWSTGPPGTAPPRPPGPAPPPGSGPYPPTSIPPGMPHIPPGMPGMPPGMPPPGMPGMWYPPPGAAPPGMGQPPMFIPPPAPPPGLPGAGPPPFGMHPHPHPHPHPPGAPMGPMGGMPGMMPGMVHPPITPFPAGPRPLSSFSFPPGLIPELCRDKAEHSEPYCPLSPSDIEAAGLPPPPVKDAYLRSRLDRFHAEIEDYRPGMMRCDVDEQYRDRKDVSSTQRDPGGYKSGPSKGGMQADGSYSAPEGSESASQYAGLGSHRPKEEREEDDDMYNQYRKIRSGVYHETLSKAQAAAAALVASVPR